MLAPPECGGFTHTERTRQEWRPAGAVGAVGASDAVDMDAVEGLSLLVNTHPRCAFGTDATGNMHRAVPASRHALSV